MRCCFIENRDERILTKIVGYCARIEENLNRFDRSYSAFQKDHLFQDGCCMCVVQIGELVTALSDELKTRYSDVPWRIIKDTRNFYVHDYGSLDIEAVWETLNQDIPYLKSYCEKILTSER